MGGSEGEQEGEQGGDGSSLRRSPGGGFWVAVQIVQYPGAALSLHQTWSGLGLERR
jgi:hypothetical protein